MINLFKKMRFDCIVIWGHGEIYLDDVLQAIRDNTNFDIVHIHKQEVSNIKKLVYQIYSFDYAPLFHLKAKVKYLETTPPVVNFIFAKNHDAQEEFFGTGVFRHKESLRIKAFKEKIRDKFNPRDSKGQMTHDHVIHATDNESQTDSILKLLGYTDGVKMLMNKNKIVATPHYIKESKQFLIMQIPYTRILCTNVKEENGKVMPKHIPIHESVQYLGLTTPDVYDAYVKHFRGLVLKQDYDVDKYLKLKDKFAYLTEGYTSYLIVVTKIKDSDKYLVLDGLHRASLHLFQGNKRINVCVI